MATIISDFYQSYLNAFAPNVYYNTNASSAFDSTAILHAPVARAGVSILHAASLEVLLLLLAILMAITLRRQRIPDNNSIIWGIQRDTILGHIQTCSQDLFSTVGPQGSNSGGAEALLYSLNPEKEIVSCDSG
jgi:hypothetical protein